jgi:hypothetical protein
MRADGISVIDPEKNETAKIDFCLQGDGKDLTTLPDGQYTVTALTENKICTIDNQGNVTFNGTLGELKVRVAYTWTQDGQTYEVYRDVMVEAKAPYFGIELHRVELQETSGVTADTFDPNKHYVYNEDTNLSGCVLVLQKLEKSIKASIKKGDIIIEETELKGIDDKTFDV